MRAYKGFNKDMTCRGFQFEECKTYEESEAILCERGFHACTNPIDVFTYYPPATSIYHEVELDEVSEKEEEDTKICGRKIKIEKQLSLNDMISDSIEISMQLHEKNVDYSPVATSGDYSPAATSGNYSHAVTSGDYSRAATSGNYSHAATSGDYSTAATSGNYSHAVTSGDYSYAATSGNSSHAVTSGNYSPAATSGNSSHAATSGDSSHAVTSGKCSHAATSGDYSHAATSGNYSPAATSGDSSHAATSGSYSHAATSGDSSIAAAIGRNSKAKSTIGNWIVLAEYGEWNGKTYPVLCVKCGKIDGVSLKPDTWYRLKNGEFVEV